MKSKNDKATEVPKFAIVNDLFYGYPPNELTDLNKTELALISSGKINQHLFCYMTGVHDKIKGCHTLKCNNVQHTNKVLNYLSSMELTTIKVVLTGPFTSTQNAKVRKASKVWLPKMK